MKVFGERKRAVAVLAAAGALLALAACTPGQGATSASSPSASTAAATSEASTTAPPSPSAQPGTSATVGALVAGFPEQLLPVMPSAKVESSSFDKTRTPATVALVGKITLPAAGVVAYYSKQLEDQGFKPVPGEAVGSVVSKDFLRGDNETVNLAVVETAGVSTFTIGANVAAESVK
ncbi:hypothetical protein AB4Y86_07835 [Arthrobacter sp. 2YAF22_2]|uniref:hypothetical protein n=1 Tax=Arthrobacter sp. 2YAF22_2 TaxID=3233029 RepID=UPI003F920CA8